MFYWFHWICVSPPLSVQCSKQHPDLSSFQSIGFIETNHFYVWQSFFWICGAMTFVYGIVVGIFLPDNPIKAKFLNEREKAIAIDRVRVNQTGELQPVDSTFSQCH